MRGVSFEYQGKRRVCNFSFVLRRDTPANSPLEDILSGANVKKFGLSSSFETDVFT